MYHLLLPAGFRFISFNFLIVFIVWKVDSPFGLLTPGLPIPPRPFGFNPPPYFYDFQESYRAVFLESNEVNASLS